MAKQMVKERQDITGLNCIKGASRKVIVDGKGVKDSWKEYMEKLMNEENEWDHKISAEVKEGPADCIRMAEVRAELEIFIPNSSIFKNFSSTLWTLIIKCCSFLTSDSWISIFTNIVAVCSVEINVKQLDETCEFMCQLVSICPGTKNSEWSAQNKQNKHLTTYQKQKMLCNTMITKFIKIFSVYNNIEPLIYIFTISRCTLTKKCEYRRNSNRTALPIQ